MSKFDRYLILGYGNPLRSDDGAGYRVAEIVAHWQLETVKSQALQQLTPDLAEAIAQASTVIFIDAAIGSELTVQLLKPDSTISYTNHFSDPRSLLYLTRILYKTVPKSYQVLIPGFNFGFGKTFSPETEKNILLTLTLINQLINFSDCYARN